MTAPRRLRQRWISFAAREDKFAWMQAEAIHDVNHPRVQHWAARFRPLPRPRREQALLAFCALAIRYESDPHWEDSDGPHGVEVLESSAVAIDRGYGDCDVKSRLLVALCLACEIPCRLSPVFHGATGFPHIRNEIQGLDGVWRLADPSVINGAIGVIPERPIVALELRRIDPWRAR